MKRTYFILLIILLVSCKGNKPNNDLELIIDNKTVVIKDTLQPDYYSPEGYKEKYEKTNGHIISYKLVNNSDKKYFVYINDEDFWYDSAPENWTSQYVNIYFTDKNDSIYEMQVYRMPPRRDTSIESKCRMLSDSLVVEKYKKIGYRDDKYFPVQNNSRKGHLYYLHPKETVHLKTFVTLPFRIDNPSRMVSGYNTFDKNNYYYIRLIVTNKEEDTKEILTTEQLRNIEVNGYEFFEGTIYSNKVPVKFE